MIDDNDGVPPQALVIELDLPPLASALGRRLMERGVPVTPARSADFARALRLVHPISRRRLYWTARSIYVSDAAQVGAFDAVFRSVFGDGATAAEPDLDDVPTAAAPPDKRPSGDHATSPRARGAAGTRK